MKCKYCHREIRFIGTVDGHQIPVDNKIVPYYFGENNRGRVVTSDGHVLPCEFVGQGDPAGYGFVPHFATCNYKKVKAAKRREAIPETDLFAPSTAAV